MTNEGQPAGPPSAVLAARLKAIRKRQGLSVQQLAELCAEAGAPELTATMIYNIESGRPNDQGKRRRHVTIDELLVLAYVLNVAPVHLILPLENDQVYEVTPVRQSETVQVREWIRGSAPLPNIDPRVFYTEIPIEEWRRPLLPQSHRDKVLQMICQMPVEEDVRDMLLQRLHDMPDDDLDIKKLLSPLLKEGEDNGEN